MATTKNPPQPAPSPRRNPVGKAPTELRGEGWGEGQARFIAVAIAKNRTVQPLTPALSPRMVFRTNVAWRRGEGAGCGLAWDSGFSGAGL